MCLRLVISLIVLAKLILEQTNYHPMNAYFHEVSLIISYWSAEAIRDDMLMVMVFSRSHSQHNATEINYNQLYKSVLISRPKFSDFIIYRDKARTNSAILYFQSYTGCTVAAYRYFESSHRDVHPTLRGVS